MKHDKSLLTEFVNELFQWLEFCHEGYGGINFKWPMIHPIKLFQVQAHKAWHELKQSELKDQLNEKIRSISEDAMIRSGLFGAQLSYKLDLLRHRAKLALRGSSTTKRRFIDYLEILLESLLDLLGAGTALKELIGALKAQLR